MKWNVRTAGLLACMFAVQGMAAELPVIPEKPQVEQFKGTPAPWREYLVRARAAERVADPLQRCLAFPDLPGNRWPAGHAEAHCRYHHAKVVTLAQVDAHLQNGDVTGLERILSATLDRHFSEEAFSEEIHRFFEQFQDANSETDRITSLWLDKAPESPFALLARGAYFADAAWNARGGKGAAETPRESLREMNRLADLAVPFMQQAAKVQPRLMPAYALAINVGMLDSRADLEAWAFKAARKHDPGCVDVARRRMNSLQPRWGGSYEAMLAYANELATQSQRRPMVAMHQGAPYGDRGDRLIAEDQFTQETAEVLDFAVATGSNEGYMHDAANVAIARKDGAADSIKGLAHLLQEARFNEGGAWADRAIGWNLLRSAEPEWALRYLTRAEKAESGEAWVQYLLGAAFYRSKRFDQAQVHYLKAMEDEQHLQASLRELSAMWLYDAGLEPKQAAARARPFIDRLRTEYPDDGRGLVYRIDQQARENAGHVDPESLKHFLKVADRSDPMQKDFADRIEAFFRQGASNKGR